MMTLIASWMADGLWRKKYVFFMFMCILIKNKSLPLGLGYGNYIHKIIINDAFNPNLLYQVCKIVYINCNICWKFSKMCKFKIILFARHAPISFYLTLRFKVEGSISLRILLNIWEISGEWASCTKMHCGQKLTLVDEMIYFNIFQFN